jgi:hypothetical protein
MIPPRIFMYDFSVVFLLLRDLFSLLSTALALIQVSAKNIVLLNFDINSELILSFDPIITFNAFCSAKHLIEFLIDRLVES